jgi:hypothetical protein
MNWNLEKTKHGIPALWERGGGYSNTGNALIIADANGNAKPANYIKKRGELACNEHALIPVTTGDYIISADHHRGDFDIRVYRIAAITCMDSCYTAEMELVNHFSEDEWDAEPAEFHRLLYRSKQAR